jgi:hypothetical protein
MVVAVGNAGRIRTSFDGVSWTLRTVDFLTTSQAFTGIAFGNDRFVVSCDTAIAGVSIDGITWTRVSIPSAAAPYMVYANLFINAEEVTSTLFLSRDGIDWTTMSGIGVFGANFITALGTDGSIVVAFDSAGKAYYTATTTYASEADLLDDSLAPMPGEAKAYLAGGYFRLGGTPDGIVTADVTQGAASANRTTAQLANLVLARLTSAPSFAAGDVTALDLAASAVNGYWSIEDGVTCANVLDFLVGTPGASWFVGNDGSFHLKQLTAPSGTPDLTVVADDLTKLERVSSSDDGGGVPPWKIQVRWGKYYQTITSDIAGAVTDEDRAQFAQEWRDVTSSDATILTEHPSSQVMVIESAFSAASTPRRKPTATRIARDQTRPVRPDDGAERSDGAHRHQQRD